MKKKMPQSFFLQTLSKPMSGGAVDIKGLNGIPRLKWFLLNPKLLNVIKGVVSKCGLLFILMK